jgi:hypothetical protein
MSREEIEQAKRLIDKGQYRAARALLERLDSLEADELLIELDILENQRPSLLRSGYALVVLLGVLIPLVIGIAAFTLAGGFEKARVILAIPSALPTLPPEPTPTTTSSPTHTVTPSPTPTPTPTFTPTNTPLPTLPPTWTPTPRPIVHTPDATGTRLVFAIATGQALVAATDTMAARNIALRTSGTQVLGVVGTPSDACTADAREWWRSTRLAAADTFFNLSDDYETTIALVLEQPTQYRGLLDGLRVDFLEELRTEAMQVGYPPCAHTAREMLLAYMQECILSYRSMSAGDQPKYAEHVRQAEIYDGFFERELDILGVARG